MSIGDWHVENHLDPMIADSTPRVFIEEGAVRRLGELLDRLNAERLFFVVDELAYRVSGAEDELAECLRKRDVVWFGDFELNPKIDDVERGKALFLEEEPDVIVALGGGSALDIAKLIGTCSVQKGPTLDYVTGRRILEQDGPPMVAIPTTAGTGSEATHFAVVYVDDQKFSVAAPAVLPEYAIIDPKLTWSLPPRVTASTGLDALCQSVESIWSVGATDESIRYAEEALELTVDSLERTVMRPTPGLRMNMARAAHMAGKAINISKTTAPHAVSYAITTRFGVPHGAAVALTLGPFLNFNYQVSDSDCNDPRRASHVKKRIRRVLDVLANGSITRSQERIRSIIRNIDCPVGLADVGVAKRDVAAIAENVNLERLSNNPRKISHRKLLELLEAIQ